MGRKPKDPGTYKKDTIRGLETEIGEAGTFVYLNRNWRVKIGALNYDIEQRGTRITRGTGEEAEKWECEGHYGSLRQAMLGLIEKGLKDSAGSMNKMAEMFNELKAILFTYPDLLYVIEGLKRTTNYVGDASDVPMLEVGPDDSVPPTPKVRGRKKRIKDWEK